MVLQTLSNMHQKNWNKYVEIPWFLIMWLSSEFFERDVKEQCRQEKTSEDSGCWVFICFFNELLWIQLYSQCGQE